MYFITHKNGVSRGKIRTLVFYLVVLGPFISSCAVVSGAYVTLYASGMAEMKIREKVRFAKETRRSLESQVILEEEARILKEENSIYKAITSHEMQDRLEEPFNKLICSTAESNIKAEIWEYRDQRFLDGSKYYIFGLSDKKLITIKNEIPFQCCAFSSDITDKSSLTHVDICSAESMGSDAFEAFNFLKLAEGALSRDDQVAAYRLLEEQLISEHRMVRKQALKMLNENPGMLNAAKKTFSYLSLTESLDAYGENAVIIETNRLSIYKTIASQDAYLKAKNNFNRVFEK